MKLSNLPCLLALAWVGTFGAHAVSAAEADASDWPHVRGVRFDGHFPRLTSLPPWPATGPARLWEQPLGQGFSGMVVGGGRVFTLHQTSSGQELVCLDLRSGAVIWRTRFAYPWEMDGRYPGPYGTPTLAGGKVYFADCYGSILCAREDNGSIAWRFDATKLPGSTGVDFGYAATPLVLDGRLYAPAPAGGGGATLFCLDAATGDLIWHGGSAHPSYGSCQPLMLGGRELILLPLRNGVGLFDRATGAERWKDEWTRGYDEHSIWPIYEEPLLFCPSAFRRGARVYRLAWIDGEVRAESVWEDRILSNDVLPSALFGGNLFGFDVQSQQAELYGRTRGTLKCVAFATGTVRWTRTGISHCSLTLVGDRLVLLDDEGGLALLEPDPGEFRELARASLPQKGKIWAAPVFVGDRLLVRGAGSVACYAVGAGVVSADRTARETPVRSQATEAPGVFACVHGWFGHYRTDAFIAPSLRVLLEWYLCSVALLAIAFGVDRRLPGAARCLDWTLSAVVLGVAGTFLLTVTLERFIFVAPVSLFALFAWSVPECRDPRRGSRPGPRRLQTYVPLMVFVAVCFGYYWACSGVFLVSGWGFLSGFPAVVLLSWCWRLLPQRATSEQRFLTRLWGLIAFTAYFGVSAVAVRWYAT